VSRSWLLTSVALVLLACGAAPTTAPTSGSHIPGPSATDFVPVTTCARYPWPPAGLTASFSGVKARSLDAIHIEITNATDADLSVRVSSWYIEEHLDCGVGALEVESMRGPLPANTTLVYDGGPGGGDVRLPLTLGIWEHGCGEPCSDPPVAWLIVPRSDIRPLGT
jgi:hypothetical protein